MKNLTSKLMAAALALTGVVSVASAQQLKSEIPFPFRVSGTLMPAGTYEIGESRTGGAPVFHMLNTDVHRPVLVLPAATIGLGAHSSDTKLVFECGASGCALAQIWTGTAWGAYTVRTPKEDARAALTIRTVLAERTK
jgi:hypothetical protein